MLDIGPLKFHPSACLSTADVSILTWSIPFCHAKTFALSILSMLRQKCLGNIGVVVWVKVACKISHSTNPFNTFTLLESAPSVQVISNQYWHLYIAETRHPCVCVWASPRDSKEWSLCIWMGCKVDSADKQADARPFSRFYCAAWPQRKDNFVCSIWDASFLVLWSRGRTFHCGVLWLVFSIALVWVTQ